MIDAGDVALPAAPIRPTTPRRPWTPPPAPAPDAGSAGPRPADDDDAADPATPTTATTAYEDARPRPRSRQGRSPVTSHRPAHAARLDPPGGPQPDDPTKPRPARPGLPPAGARARGRTASRTPAGRPDAGRPALAPAPARLPVEPAQARSHLVGHRAPASGRGHARVRRPADRAGRSTRDGARSRVVVARPRRPHGGSRRQAAAARLLAGLAALFLRHRLEGRRPAGAQPGPLPRRRARRRRCTPRRWRPIGDDLRPQPQRAGHVRAREVRSSWIPSW